MTHRGLPRSVVIGLAMWAVVMVVYRDVHAQVNTSDPTSIQSPVSPAVARSAAGTFFPGSLSLNTGLASPLEDDNLIANLSLEQGVTLIRRGPHRLVPFVTLQGSGDRAGFDWNNKVVWQVGTKYARGFRSGVVQFGGGYAHERRLNSGSSEGRALWFGNYWFGWQLSRADRFPGSSWATVGTPAPTEHKNVIAMSSIEQGVAIVKVAGVALVPFVEHLLALDSAGRPWNNRHLMGEGVKLRIPTGRGTIEAAAVYKHERRWIEHRSRAGATATVNLWYGWDPSNKH